MGTYPGTTAPIFLSRRGLLAVATSAAAAAGLAACGKDGSSSGPGGGSAEIAGDLTFSYWDQNQKPAIDAHIKAFTEKYPKVTITTSITPWDQYWTKLQTQAGGSNLPDLFWMNGPNITLYASNEMLEPLDDLAESGEISWDNYPQALVDLYTVDGTHYGIPKDYDTLGIFYNKKLFDAAGVPYPSDDWTWEDFSRTANTISTALKDQGVYGVATGLTGGQEGYYNTIAQAGGYVVKDGTSGYGEPEAVRGIQFWTDLIASGASPSMEAMADTKPNVMFESGKSAMFWSGTWIISELAEKLPNKDDVDLAPLPRDKQPASVIHGLTTVVSASSANKAAAKAFVAFLGQKEQNDREAELGTANPAFTGTQEAFRASQPQWNMEVFAQAADEYAVPYPVSKNTQAWNDLENQLLPDAFSSKRPVAEVCADLASQMNAALASE